MLKEAELWVADFNVTFSTDPDPKKSKSKLMCGSNKRLAKPADISLCDRALPWVASATHLGHEIHSDILFLTSKYFSVNYVSVVGGIAALHILFQPYQVARSGK